MGRNRGFLNHLTNTAIITIATGSNAQFKIKRIRVTINMEYFIVILCCCGISKNDKMIGKTTLFKLNQPFTTELDYTFPSLEVTYKTWGTLNEDGSNAVLICHALTGNADADEWFPGLFADNKILNLDEQFIICSNVLGGCYGSTGPVSINPETGKAYQADFPKISIRDMVRVQRLLLNDLGVKSIELAIGGSMGGMQVLEWLVMDNRIQKAVLIAMGKRHSPWTIGFSEAQRRAIMADKNWENGFYTADAPPSEGLAAARMMGMMMYRSAPAFERRFGRELQDGHDDMLQVNSYLNYQGDKLVKRFDANTYIRLTQAMDTHDIARGRGTYEKVLSSIHIPLLIIGISSDVLYPVAEQKELEKLITQGIYYELVSDEGHDAFLIEFSKMKKIYTSFNQMLFSNLSTLL